MTDAPKNDAHEIALRYALKIVSHDADCLFENVRSRGTAYCKCDYDRRAQRVAAQIKAAASELASDSIETVQRLLYRWRELHPTQSAEACASDLEVALRNALEESQGRTEQ